MPIHPLDWIDDSLDDLKRQDLRRYRRVGIQPTSETPVSNNTVSNDDASNEGPNPELINFSTNDYLGLANDPRLAEAAYAAAKLHGWGAGASPVVSGRSAAHAELEAELAKFENTEAAMLFPSGFAANAGVIPALVDEGDALFTDEKNHASLIDGCRLSRARRFVYPHADVRALEQLLADSGTFRRRLIVTDTLFSMDGDFAPLAEIGHLAEQYGAMLMVDEAHGTGVWGKQGRGVVEHCSQNQSLAEAPTQPLAEATDKKSTAALIAAPIAALTGALEQQVTIRVGTLSKAFGSAGGFVSGERRLINWLYNRARPYVFSTASPAALAGASLAALRIAQEEPHRRERVQQLATHVRTTLQEAGWNTGNSTSQIIPLLVGSPAEALRLSEQLAAAGCSVPAIRPPSVPEGESLLRISLSSGHTDQQIEHLLKTLQTARQKASLQASHPA